MSYSTFSLASPLHRRATQIRSPLWKIPRQSWLYLSVGPTAHGSQVRESQFCLPTRIIISILITFTFFLKIVLDLSRLVLGYCEDIFSDTQARQRFLSGLFTAAEWTDGSEWVTPQPKTHETNVLLVLRAVANVFREGAPINEGSWVNHVRVMIPSLIWLCFLCHELTSCRY
jgi:hypothetical protein